MYLPKAALLAWVMVASPVMAASPTETPPTAQTTWHCIGRSPGGKVDIQVDRDGHAYPGEATWDGDVGTEFPVHATMLADLPGPSLNDLRGRVLFLTADLSDRRWHDAVHGRRFHWVITTHSDLNEKYAGTPAFSGPFENIDDHHGGDHPELEVDSDDAFAMVRGSEHLFLLAIDRKGQILSRSELRLDVLRTWPASLGPPLQAAMRVVPDYRTACERDDHDQIVV